ncbi:TIMELESS-interacting protein [Rhinatrema bivittatum]|uniref:TIMELESS-interacting protein n=1 Tax=Rhinatrema bivittatum TaxID=194408 RepID=UPI00112C41D1|nr:TIMELESS-interacting protein [Rhinatrema bivittatum]XP_029430507.1 TIMELESS-interacting protein [Rhinatrema bivittatum]XP_029430508.1 TIMELESS-interacting protein [Rhinatrema bivittatum]
MDPFENGLFDLPDYEHTEDEAFPPLPPPFSPGAEDEAEHIINGVEDSDGNKDASLAENPPVAVRKAVKRSMPKLDAQRLISERGLPALRHMFEKTKFRGKGHEAEDLKTLIQHMEHWAHRLFPKLQFEDFMERLETLGNKREVQTCLKQIRLDLPLSHEDFIGNKGEGGSNGLDEPSEDLELFSEIVQQDPPSLPPTGASLSEEQQQRIARNRQLALQRRQAKTQASDGSSCPLAASPPVHDVGTAGLQDPDDLADAGSSAELTNAPVETAVLMDQNEQLETTEEN